jgi:tetratricopeptide (TPR) repeat protein
VTHEELLEAGRARLHEAQFDAAHDLFSRAEAAAVDDAGREMAAIMRASVPVLQEQRDADLSVFRQNILRRRSPLHVLRACYYLFIGLIDRHADEDAARYLKIMREAAAEVADPIWIARAYDAAASVESRLGKHAEAIELSDVAVAAALELPESAEVTLVRVMALHNRAYNLLAAGRHDEAYEAAMLALPIAEATSYPTATRECLMTLAFASLGRGDLGDAERYARDAEPYARGQRAERYVHYVLGAVAHRRGDVEEAELHFEKLRQFYPDVPNLTEMLLSTDLAPFLLPE